MMRWLGKILRYRSKKWQPLWDTPWSRLWLFATAVFCIFSVIGFFSDLLNRGTYPFGVALIVATMCGLNAVLWIVVMARLPLFAMGLLIVFQFYLGIVITWACNWAGRTFSMPPVPSETGIRFAAWGILIVVITAYAFIVGYFRAEGIATGRIRNELELAHGIQKTLVPPILLRTDLFEVYGLSQPSDKVGGDLVDAVMLPGGDMIAYLADIAGHGLPAGILMGMLKTAARTALLDATVGDPSESLPALLEKLNRVLPHVKEPQMYATLTAFRLNADGSVWYAMAASPPVLHWSPHRGDLSLVQEEQYPLGLLPISGFTGAAIELNPGDLLVVATDGVLEVCDKKEEEFGIERLEQTIEAHARGSLPDLTQAILDKARAFGKQTDDQTLLVIRRNK
ncbi:MAG TPA: PP2C family protein-serine/threonine phosphatase [Acidobacteriaceae bacterium]|nr:PP2C family protein-serine/threonine phosphatase [Acidobacteriaceae bacterium]